MGLVYYDDTDKFARRWLRNLRDAGHIPVGFVDDRPIQQVTPESLDGYARHHFFAGIGGWELALQLADWPEDQPVWTGSCPCQPFSNAGQGKGEADERHLWPDWLKLIAVCKPPVIFGEQVASKAGRLWLSRVRADLEALGYAVGAADLCSAGVGAPHIRQRLCFVAYLLSERHPSIQRQSLNGVDNYRQNRGSRYGLKRGGSIGELAYADDQGLEVRRRQRGNARAQQPSVERSGEVGGLGHSNLSGEYERPSGGEQSLHHAHDGKTGGLGDAARREIRLPRFAWEHCYAANCGDGKARRVGPGLFPLAHGVPARVGRLRGYGNAINPILTAEFIRAFMEVRGIA